MKPLGNDLAIDRVVYSVGSIARFRHDWIERGLFQSQVHFVNDLPQRRTGLPSHAGDELGKVPPRLPQMPAYHLVLFIQKLGAELVQDDELFNAALVSFGSFGIIHGVLIETEELFLMETYMRRMPYDDTLKKLMETLNFSTATLP